jgi:LysM repeat protein
MTTAYGKSWIINLVNSKTLMKTFALIFVILFQSAFMPSLFAIQSNGDDSDKTEIEMSNEEWHLKRDQYAVGAIQLLSRLDKLNGAIDSLKKLNEEMENNISSGCDARLLALVGASKDSYEDFRIKFDETEKKIVNKTGTPDDARKMYFDEITGSRIRCLPEFSDRYNSLKRKLEPWENTEAPEKSLEGNYLVAKGDCLWKISQDKYNTPYLWPVIWDANKINVVNSEEIYGRKFKSVSNPDLIYPGQVLKIPKVSDSQLNNAKEREEEFNTSPRKNKFFRRKKSPQQ